MKQKIKICMIINPSFALSVLYDQVDYWIKNDLEVTCISSPGKDHEVIKKLGAFSKPIKIERYPAIIKDAISLFRIFLFLLFHRYDIIHISTPKAAFLGSLASRLSGHKNIFYLVRGRPYEHTKGIKRKLMNFCEWITCNLSKVVVPVSKELGDDLISSGICPSSKNLIIAKGSSAGVDTLRFSKNIDLINKASEIKTALGINASDVIILFVGWIRKEKGVNELVSAYKKLSEKFSNIRLILLGNYQDSDAIDDEVFNFIKSNNKIHHVPWTQNPEVYYALSDFLVLPSYREGFPRVALEASSMELPVIASDIMGCREAVLNNLNGFLFKLNDIDELAVCMEKLISNPLLRRTLGAEGRKYVLNYYSQNYIWSEHLKKYLKMLKS